MAKTIPERATLMVAAALLAFMLSTPGAGAGGSSSLDHPGACCIRNNECQDLSKADCRALKKAATWFEGSCDEIGPCGVCVGKANASACWFAPEDQCLGSDWGIGFVCISFKDACAVEQAYPNEPTITGNLSSFRDFRDHVLAEDELGRSMIALYDEHSTELTYILIRNPDLHSRGMELLEQAASGLQELNGASGGKDFVMSSGRVQEIDSFLADVAEQASVEAAAALDQVRAEVQAVEGKSLPEILEGKTPGHR